MALQSLPGPWGPSRVDARDRGRTSAAGPSAQPLSSLEAPPGRWPVCLGGRAPSHTPVWTPDAPPRSVEAWGGEATRSCPWSPSRSEGPRAARSRQSPTHWRLVPPQVLMSSPYEGEGRGVAMLNLLRTLSHSIAPSMADLWELEIPLLIKYLEGEGLRAPPRVDLPLRVQAGAQPLAGRERQEPRLRVGRHLWVWSWGRWGGEAGVRLTHEGLHRTG